MGVQVVGIGVSVVTGIIAVLAYYKTSKADKDKASAEMLNTLSDSLTGEVKRCNDECRFLRSENNQLRLDMADARREGEIEIQKLKTEIRELRKELAAK